jgi:YD repeat-containing protein
VAGGYDANQNLTNDGSRQFGYDGENRLTGTGGGGTTPLALVYDPLGRLQQTTAGTGASAAVKTTPAKP